MDSERKGRRKTKKSYSSTRIEKRRCRMIACGRRGRRSKIISVKDENVGEEWGRRSECFSKRWIREVKNDREVIWGCPTMVEEHSEAKEWDMFVRPIKRIPGGVGMGREAPGTMRSRNKRRGMDNEHALTELVIVNSLSWVAEWFSSMRAPTTPVRPRVLSGTGESRWLGRSELDADIHNRKISRRGRRKNRQSP